MLQNRLKIVTWNANGVTNKKLELEMFLNLEKIDVCLITETHLTNQSLLKIKGYNVYNTPHPSNLSRGGSAIIIKDGIIHHEMSQYQSDEIQFTIVQIKSMKQKINIGALYCPPNYKINKDLFKDIFKIVGERFIIGGDYNAKMLCGVLD